MKTIFCLAEHRRGELRSITLEILGKAQELGEKLDAKVISILLGYDLDRFADQLVNYADSVLLVDDERLKEFNQLSYQKVIMQLIRNYNPVLILIGHTAFGMELAPSLAVEAELPIATDCIDIQFGDGGIYAVRQMYGGKVNAILSFPGAEKYIFTVRQGAFQVKQKQQGGKIIKESAPLEMDTGKKKFVGYIEPEVGEVDISQADIIVAVGRGIKKRENIPVIQELADAMGGVLACSRPVVDSEWLPKDRQVGQSGKTVKPKLYLAVGISGAFQHLMGMRDSETIIAINKDENAPIFNVADYGVVDDLFKVVPALSAKIKEMKGK